MNEKEKGPTHPYAASDFHVCGRLGRRPHDHEGVEVEPHLADVVIVDGADLGGAGARGRGRGLKVGVVLRKRLAATGSD